MWYEISIREPNGELVTIIDNEISLDVSLRVNDVGTLTLNLPCCDKSGTEHMVTDWGRDYRIEVCVQCDCSPATQFMLGETPFFIRKIEKCQKAGKCSFNIQAYSALDIMRRRLVPYLPKSNEAKGAGDAADQRIIRLFEETAGSRAGHYLIQNTGNHDPVREAIYDAGLIDFDNAGPFCGQAYQGKFGGKTALSAMQDMATASEAKGTPVYFGIVQDACGDTMLHFEARCDYWGTDRTGTGKPVSSETETVGDHCISFDYSREVNRVYTQGGDDADDETNYSVSNGPDLAAILADDPFALVEKFISDKSWETPDERTDQAQTEFGRVQILQFSGTLTDRPGYRFGCDWNFGDKVTVADDGLVFDAIISGLHFSSSNGVATVNADLTAGQKSGSMSGIARMLQDLKSMQDEIIHLRQLVGL